MPDHQPIGAFMLTDLTAEVNHPDRMILGFQSISSRGQTLFDTANGAFSKKNKNGR